LVDRGVDRVAVRARDAGTEADYGVVEAEPRLATTQSRLERLDALADRRELPVRRPPGPGLGRQDVVADAVLQRLAGHGRPGQPVGIRGGPEAVGVVVVAEVRAPPVRHADTGVPALEVLAVDGLVEGGADAPHGDGERPGRTT